MRYLLLIALAGLLIVGCFDTTVALDEHPEKAKVDRSLVGDWSFPARGDEKAVTLLVRNLDDKQYYLEWQIEGEKPLRMAGFVSAIKDASFAQVRQITDDGEIPEKHLILRVSTADNKLGIRQLSEGFFKQHPANDTKTLRDLLEKNLDTADMYDGEFRYASKK